MDEAVLIPATQVGWWIIAAYLFGYACGAVTIYISYLREQKATIADYKRQTEAIWRQKT